MIIQLLMGGVVAGSDSICNGVLQRVDFLLQAPDIFLCCEVTGGLRDTECNKLF